MNIGEVARLFQLSRGTLLYYDAVGLLRPSVRSEARYRQYSEDDMERLRRICLYRSAGVPLADIGRMLDGLEPGGYAAILRRRLEELNHEIATLKKQQQLTVRLLFPHDVEKECRMLNKDQFVALMRATGLTEEDMHRWHQEFEKMSGDAHQEFLASLGIGAEEIQEIRKWSR